MDELDKKRWMAVVAMVAWVAQAAYVLFPFDLLPDLIPIIGWLDDLVALVGLGATTVWVWRSVRDARFPELFANEPGRLRSSAGSTRESEPYEPIPADVIRSM
jgi:hypothetical protein